MREFDLHLFGPPRLQRAGAPIDIRRRKSLALLAYLAVTGRPHSRDALALLLWPDAAAGHARASLRSAICCLSKAMGAESLDASRAMVGLGARAQLSVDVRRFRELLAESALHGHADVEPCPACLRLLAEAVALHHDEFLCGFSLRDSPGFDEWQLIETARLRDEAKSALARLTRGHAAAGSTEVAIRFARRLLALDLLDETSHRLLMRLYAQAGEPAAALRQYQECTRILRDELGLGPAEATTELYREVKAARRPAEAAAERAQAQPVGQPVDAHPTAVVPEEGIRVVTVLVAGMGFGYESREELGHPEERAGRSSALLRAARAAVTEHQGTMAEPSRDDVVAIFGAPVAHEDDAERAVKAAMETVKRGRRLGIDVSIGIGTGAMYWSFRSAGGPPPVAGPVMNRACRLQSKAGTGQILVCETTYRRTYRAFKLLPATMRMSGAVQPVVAYRVLAANPRPRKPYGIPGMQTELIGRAEELRNLRTAWSRVRRGHGQLVCLTGEAGIGKSRLVGELGRCIRTSEGERSAWWLEGSCQQSSAMTAYAPFRQILHDLFDWQPRDGTDEQGEKLARFLANLRDQGALAADRIEETGAILIRLVCPPAADRCAPCPKDADPQEVQRQTFPAIRDVLFAAARKRPMVLVLEDLHWADDLTLDLIDSLLEDVRRFPLLLVCVYRVEPEHRCRNLPVWASRRCPEHWLEVRLRQLSESEGQRILESLLGQEQLPRSAKALVLQRSQGNPLFLEEVLRSLIDTGAVYRDGGIWKARDGFDETAIAPTIQTLIQSRVDRLQSSQRELLEIASVIGQRVLLPVLECAARDRTDFSRDVQSLERAAFLYSERSFPEAEYGFSHVMVQEAVYQAIAEERRRAMHERVGKAIEEVYRADPGSHIEDLAYHFDRSANAERAVTCLLEAGEKARRAFANREALGYFRRAEERLQEAGWHTSRRDLVMQALVGSGRIHSLISEARERERFFRRSISVARSLEATAGELLFFYAGLAKALTLQDRVDDLNHLVHEAWGRVQESRDTPEAVSIVTLYARQFWQENNEFYSKLMLQNAPLIRSLPYSEELAETYETLGWAYLMRNRIEECRQFLLSMEKELRAGNERKGLAHLLYGIGACLCHQTGDQPGAITRLSEARALFDEMGDTYHVGSTNLWLSFCYDWLRNLPEQQRSAERAVAAFRAAGETIGLSQACYMLASSLICQGRRREGIAALHESVRVSEDIRVPFSHAERLVPTAVFLRGLGKRSQALEMLREALHLYSKPDDQDLRQNFAVALAVLEEEMGDPEAFRSYCQEFRRQHPRAGESVFQHWVLDPAAPGEFLRTVLFEDFRSPLSAQWIQRNTATSEAVSLAGGLVVQAPSGSEFWYRNLTAPRIGVTISGDFAVTTVCRSAFDDRPAVGGLYLFHDDRNYLHLERGFFGAHQLTFKGYFLDRDRMIGRGYLPSLRLHLRLERRGQAVTALCSADGNAWWTLGRAAFPAPDPVEVGVHAGARIMPNVYQGEHPHGSAMRFESLRIEQ